MKSLFIFMLLIGYVLAAPWFDLFGVNTSYNPKPKRPRQGKTGKQRWKEICRTLNPEGFTYPGQVPVPAVPVCPF